MLCETCDSIILDFAGTSVSEEICRYANLDALQVLSSQCDFCHLVYEDAKQLDDPSSGQYCKQSWGMDFYRQLRSQSPVLVEHRSWQNEHNIVLVCFFDAENTDGYPGGPKSLSWRAMLGGVYVEPDSSASLLVSGRPLAVDSTKADILKMARIKYEECRLNHVSCQSPQVSSFIPARLLDLTGIRTTGRSVRVLTVPASFKESYAALSYCWGTAPNLRLTTEKFDRLTREGMPCDELPATIGDACELCYEMGIRYLWVCSLCIVQDSPHDWLEQSSTMGEVYNGAEITIAAAGSDWMYHWAVLSTCLEDQIHGHAGLARA